MAYQDRTVLFSGATSVAAGTTDSVVVPAVAGQKIRVLSMQVAAAAATPSASVVFNSKPAGAGSAISPTFATAAGQTLSADAQAGLFQTNAGEGLSATTRAGTSATTLSGTYCQNGDRRCRNVQVSGGRRAHDHADSGDRPQHHRCDVDLARTSVHSRHQGVCRR